MENIFGVLLAHRTLIGQILGYVGILMATLIYLQKTHKRLVFMKFASDLFWLMHYFLIGAYTGGFICIISICRSLVFMNDDKKWAKSKLWLVLFLTLGVCSTAYTWAGPKSLLALGASISAIISYWQPSPRVSRILAFPISIFMGSYGALNGSIPVVANETLSIISSILGIIKHDIKRTPKTTQPTQE